VWTGCIAFVALVVGAGAWATISRPPAPTAPAPYTGPIDGIPCTATPASGQSFRVHLDIWIGERAMSVPAGTGTVTTQTGTCAYYLTSQGNTAGAATNIISVAAPAGLNFTLGQFFAIWGMPLGSGDLMGHTAYGSYSVRSYVDGHAYTGNPAAIPLHSGEEIALEYGPPWHAPIPSTYTFPAAVPAASGTSASSATSTASSSTPASSASTSAASSSISSSSSSG
jgi:hypothetical protein